MTACIYRWTICCVAVAAALGIASLGRAQTPTTVTVGGEPQWQYPASETVRTEVFQWLGKQEGAQAAAEKASEVWPADDELQGVALLDRVVQVLALADERARELIEYCAAPHMNRPLPDTSWLQSEQSEVVAPNLRLYYGRWLSQNRLYDESLVTLEGLKPEQVADPASLLFYRSVAHHWMLAKTEGLAELNRLLQRSSELPRRYQSLATLMQADLLALEDESLDHISRRMGDIKRRLELASRVKKTIEVEDGVIASLDKLIKDMEDQQQKQQQQSSQSQDGGQSGRPSAPAPDTMPQGGNGPGEVVKKDIGSESGWGDLPPKQRQEALQGMSKDLPSHYREVIEFYFRRLASEGNASE